MKYLILLLALIPIAFMGSVYVHTLHFEWFDSVVAWSENAFGYHLAEPRYLAYFLSKMAGVSAIWLLIVAFWVNPLHTYIRFDLREFKKLLGGFAVFYALLHVILFLLAYDFAFSRVANLFALHPFLTAGIIALGLLTLAPLVRAWYRLIYIAVVLVMVHLLLGYRTLGMEHIMEISLLAFGLALRLIKR